MSGIVKKSFNNPDELRSPDKANVHVCDLGGVAAAKMVLQPGWSWSTCIKPVVGGESCQARHVGTVLSGSLERSNVDITEELVNLITAQRNFQANAKSIETTAATTQAIVNIRM